jgi:hypothetical protein
LRLALNGPRLQCHLSVAVEQTSHRLAANFKNVLPFILTWLFFDFRPLSDVTVELNNRTRGIARQNEIQVSRADDENGRRTSFDIIFNTATCLSIYITTIIYIRRQVSHEL